MSILRRGFAALATSVVVAGSFLVTAVALPTIAFADDEEATGSLRVRVVEPNASKPTPNAALTPAKPGAVHSPNPWLSYLPVGVEPDHEGWTTRMKMEALQRAAIRMQADQASGATLLQINQNENEPSNAKGQNDVFVDAEAVVGFGTGSGDDPSADISGTLRPANPPVNLTPNAEENGSIATATITNLMDDQSLIATANIGDGAFGIAQENPNVATDLDAEDDGSITLANDTLMVPFDWITESATIGDGPHGSGGSMSGDWDVYKTTINGRQIVAIQVIDDSTGFRPVLVVYASDGTIFGVFDDFAFGNGFISLILELTATGGPVDFFFAVGGNRDLDGNAADELLTNPLDSSSGQGVGSEGDYLLDIQFRAPGDFDVYSFTGVAGDFITMEVDTDPYSGILDPIVAVFDSTGLLLAFNDDGIGQGSEPFDSFLSFNVPVDGTYYVVVGGFSIFPTAPVSFPEDLTDPASGPGTGSEGDYDFIISRNTLDIDIYSFELDAGDVMGMNVTGGAPFLFLFDPTQMTLIGSAGDASGIYPAASLLPGGGVSAAAIASQTGTHYAMLFGGAGAYNLELRGFRPPSEATGVRQKLFIDFDGETLDTTIFGGGLPNTTLSPLSAFLADWGLQPGDESAVIDAILANLENSIKTDIIANGGNPDFDLEILNSRDHADPFGDPDVSRIIVGGTITESGIQTIGIAQSIDPGNFEQAETGLVLLDLLSDPDTLNPNSLNQYALGGGATKIDLVGAGVGNIVSHEAGHFSANFHTDNQSVLANIMDTGGFLDGLVGVGPDRIFGTGDDSTVVFENDAYDPFEGFLGFEDTKNAMAFGLTAGAGEEADVTGFADSTGDGTPDFASFVSDPGNQPRAKVSSGADGSFDRNLNFLNPDWTGVAIDTIDDSDGNGVADDPGVAMLLVEPATGKMLVQGRVASSGVNINKINFLNADWAPVDVVVFNDPNGDGNPEDAAVGVMAVNKTTGKILLQVRDLGTGAKIATRSFLNSDYTPIAAAAVSRAGLTPLLGVLGVEKATGKILVQTRQLSDGLFIDNRKYLDSNWTASDMAVVLDGDSNGTADDPGWLVAATNDNTGANLVQARFVTNGAFIKNRGYLTPDYLVRALASSPDISGTGREEAAAYAIRLSNDQLIIQVRDFADGSRTINIFP